MPARINSMVDSSRRLREALAAARTDAGSEPFRYQETDCMKSESRCCSHCIMRNPWGGRTVPLETPSWEKGVTPVVSDADTVLSRANHARWECRPLMDVCGTVHV